jgi:hypothetical protein
MMEMRRKILLHNYVGGGKKRRLILYLPSWPWNGAIDWY